MAANELVVFANNDSIGAYGNNSGSMALTITCGAAPVISTVPISAAMRYPHGAITDTAGNMYVADTDNNCVRKLTPSGALTIFAGTCVAGFSGDGGLATAAQLNGPYALALDSVGNLYIADRINRRIRKVQLNGVISTAAGTGVAGFSGDGGAAISAQFGDPLGLAIDTLDRIYIADLSNHRIRRVASGNIETFAGTGTAGSGGDGGNALSAQFNQPGFLAIDAANNLFIADRLNNAIRKVSSAGVVSTVLGVNYSDGVAVGPDGTVYASDRYGYRIRAVDSSGNSFVFAGTGAAGYGGDGGPATLALLNQPTGLYVAQNGDLLIGDTYNHVIRRLSKLAATVNGTCGTADGVAVATAPTTNLCTTGTATPVTGTGPWNWTCNGSGVGGTNASCSAPSSAPPECAASTVATIAHVDLTAAMTAANALNYATLRQTFNVTCANGRFGVVRLPGVLLAAIVGTGGAYALVQSACATKPVQKIASPPATATLVTNAMAIKSSQSALLSDPLVGPLAAWVCQ